LINVPRLLISVTLKSDFLYNKVKNNKEATRNNNKSEKEKEVEYNRKHLRLISCVICLVNSHRASLLMELQQFANTIA
jgi:hypothetical protein